ncbi:MAG: ribonuclease R [Butyrivibrio sp.]|nr:ribonuclease R [Butyrivibrio sp.]
MGKGKRLKRMDDSLFGKNSSKSEYIVGRFVSNARGFGFVEVEGRDEDIFIPEEYVHGAFHTDTVEVELLNEYPGRRAEGRIRNILVRGLEEVVGTFQAEKNFGFVVPDNTKIQNDIFVPIEFCGGAVTGDKVVVKITDYGDPLKRRKPEGKVKEVIGNINDPGVDILSVVKNYDIPYEFPERVMNQAMRCPDFISEADMLGREDLRDVQMVTIDGEDAKDLDDAVSLHIDEKGLFHLGVHIADVTNYVQENSALDREALKRGTSVYLVDRVIPMLPHKLSNGICSLNHGEDRLALSCLMTFDENGGLLDHSIVESVINVNERMNYSDVAKILDDNDEETIERYSELVPMFRDMEKLSKILRVKRESKGAIDFDFPESKIILDKEGNPIDIVPHERNTATKLIEDFMLAANQTVAEHFYYMESPFVYRIHEQPDPEKIASLNAFVSNFGHHIKSRRDAGVSPKELQKLLKGIQGSREEAVISRMALRSMMQAKYSTECTGHFGLAFDYYCHFTSPIRRYPDLQIHRIIKDHLRGRMTVEKAQHYAEILDEVAKHSSETEHRAEEAERETDKLKKAQYMENHVGEVFDGIVSGVTNWGMFVELDNSCEGMVSAASMADDFYVYDELNLRLIGERTRKEYTLGQKVKIRVLSADRLTKAIDFRIVSEDEDEEEAAQQELEWVEYSKARRVTEDRARKVRRLVDRAGERSEDKASRRTIKVRGEEVDINEVEPDPRTGKPRKKKSAGGSKSGRGTAGKASAAGKSTSGRKVYKVHKYKKSATSKAARSAQGKGRRKKR